MKEQTFDEYMDRVFEALREKRMELGIKQGELSAMMSKPQSAIARIEAGTVRDPRISTFFQMCQALDVNPGEILGLAYEEKKAGHKNKGKDRRLEKIKSRLDMLDETTRAKVADIIESIFKLT